MTVLETRDLRGSNFFARRDSSPASFHLLSRPRRPWPDEIVMDAKTRALVDGKWKALAKELGIE